MRQRSHTGQPTATLVASLVGAAALTSAVSAQHRPIVVPTPLGEQADLFLDIPHLPGGSALGGGMTGLHAAAGNIVALQCPDGGWNWPYGGCGATYNNITAPIALGLIQAYRATGNTDFLDAAVDGANFDLTGTFSYGGTAFGSFTPAFFSVISQETGDSTWSDNAATDFFDRLTAGTYGDGGGGCNAFYPGDTYDWIERHKCQRVGSLINLRAWDIQYLPWVASLLGNADSATPADGVSQEEAFRNAVLDAVNVLNGVDPGVDPSYLGEILGLTGGVHALALTNTATFPAINAPDYPAINGIDNLCDLADVLAGLQNVNGSWYWTSNVSDPSDEDLQTTAYAVLALIAAQDAGCGPYDAAIAAGRDWIWTMQDSADGAFVSYPGGGKNIEVNGEAVSALGVPTTLDLNSDVCHTDGTVTVTIDLGDAAVEVVGGQFFLEYDNTVLQFVSADPGDPPFTLEVYEDVDSGAGTIDYAVGVPGGGSGTMDATTMAVLTFSALTEACDTADLVAFRAHTPPTRLTDNLANPIEPELSDLDEITIDESAPAIACPGDITVNADAGGCSAEVSIMPEGWEFDVNAALVSTGEPENPYAVELRSVTGDPSGPWGPTGALIWTPSAPMEFDDITHLSADFNMLTGCIIGGSPRFSIGIDSDGDGEVNGHLVVHWGPEGSPWSNCPGPGWNNTGNLLASADPRWEGAQLGGDTTMTYAEIQTLVSGLAFQDVKYFIVPLDSFWSQDQIMLVDNVQISGQTFNFGNATAMDNCDPAPAIAAVRSDALPLDAPYPTGTTTITWTATDACGNESTCQQTVTVNAVNDLVVDVELLGLDSTPIDRCITFELSGNDPTVTVSQELSFVNGVAIATVEVPCGDYDCITARDELHTLRSTQSLAVSGTQYTADLTGASDGLVGGDLNDDGLIDILDFGVFVWQFGVNYGSGDTTCATPYPHADLSGNGTVGTEDFTFISLNFLDVDETCPGALVGPIGDDLSGSGPIRQPRDRVSVRELHRMQMSELAAADLNNDGWVDAQDIALFLQRH